MVRQTLWMVALLLGFMLVKVNAGLHEEMEALEKELEELHTSSTKKKSLKDMTTDELLDELKRELNVATNNKSPLMKNDKIALRNGNHAEIHRKRFEDILNTHSVGIPPIGTKRTSGTERWRNVAALLKKELSNDISPHSDDADECKDIDGEERCKQISSYCKESGYEEMMKEKCRKTCGYCFACTDAYPRCKLLAKHGKCEEEEFVRKDCPRSCGFCKVPSPPKCSGTKFGCCWDLVTPQIDEEGSNCPHCNDDYQYICETFKQDCMSFSKPREFMHLHCRKTCGICDRKGCVARLGHECQLYKDQLDWCTLKPDLMHIYCAGTCGEC